MWKLGHITAVCLAFLAGTSSSSPVATTQLAKREDFPEQIIYAVNCYPSWCHPWDTSECHVTVSFLVWYKSWRNSQHQEAPDSQSIEYKDWSDPRDNHNNGQGFPLVWEDHEYNLWFQDSRSNVNIKINQGAQWTGTGTDVGHASNAFGVKFTCKKDSGRSIFEANGYKCFAIYYCPKTT